MSWWPAAKKLPYMQTVLNPGAAPAAFAIMRPGAGEEPAAYQRRERGGAAHGAAQTKVRLTSACTGAR